MSITRPVDGWDRNAAKLLRRRLFEGSPFVNYAPDTKYGASSPGPLTIQITEILRKHADLWALEQRTRVNVVADGKREWLLHMNRADEEIKRFLDGHKLGHGAAA